MQREYKFQLDYKRLTMIKDFFIHYYAKKSKKKHGKKLIKNLKKMFKKTNTSDLKLIRSQFDIIGQRQQANSAILHWSIKIRACEIAHKMMALNKKKVPVVDENGDPVDDDKGVPKEEHVYKEQVEA